MSNYFFSVFFFTIIVTRAALLVRPTPGPTIRAVRIHHYMYGIVGIVVGVLVHSIGVYAIGAGLFVDELSFLLMGGKTHQDNYSAASLLGTLLFVIVVFVLRHFLVALCTLA
jgi:hypothetical protein